MTSELRASHERYAAERADNFIISAGGLGALFQRGAQWAGEYFGGKVDGINVDYQNTERERSDAFFACPPLQSDQIVALEAPPPSKYTKSIGSDPVFKFLKGKVYPDALLEYKLPPDEGGSQRPHIMLLTLFLNLPEAHRRMQEAFAHFECDEASSKIIRTIVFSTDGSAGRGAGILLSYLAIFVGGGDV